MFKSLTIYQNYMKITYVPRVGTLEGIDIELHRVGFVLSKIQNPDEAVLYMGLFGSAVQVRRRENVNPTLPRQYELTYEGPDNLLEELKNHLLPCTP
jgi:hypothetical protein